MKVAAIQMTSGPDVGANLQQARALLEQSRERGASLAALPENFAFMGLKDADKRAVGESDRSGPIQDFLAATARDLKLWIVGGTMPIRVAGDGRVAAASLVFNDAGERVARYDKIHLFDVDIPGKTETYRESAHVAPGRAPVVVDTPVGKLGLSVCYDIRFPELFRSLSAAGAQIISVPSAFTGPTGRAHWETLLSPAFTRAAARPTATA
jgi:deaminated glutathione amidase